MKKLWVKPELVVLIRSKPEEAVLAHCKSGQNYGDPSGSKTFCFETNECTQCGLPPTS